MRELDKKCMDNSNQKIIAREENNRKIRLNNNSNKSIKIWQVDGCLELDGQCCDFVFDCPSQIIFCELKGKDLPKAVRQIISTMKHFDAFLNEKNIIGAIASSRCPLAGSDYQKELFKNKKSIKKYGIRFKQRNICVIIEV